MDGIITAAGLVKGYALSGVNAVNSIDFAVRDRECFGFLGPMPNDEHPRSSISSPSATARTGTSKRCRAV
jgi:hypothetical protein